VVFFIQKGNPIIARRARNTEPQNVIVLRDAEGGTTLGDGYRQVGISEPTFYVWK